MEAKDVKIGMKVIHSAQICEVIEARNDCFIIDCPIFGKCLRLPEDFEPYEEPKLEDINAFKNHLDEKANENYLTPEEAGKANWAVVKGEKLGNGMVKVNLGELSEKDVKYINALKATEVSLDGSKTTVAKMDEVIHYSNEAERYLRKINSAIHSEDHLPITQEFIESFGFELKDNQNNLFEYRKKKTEDIDLVLHQTEDLYSMHELTSNPENGFRRFYHFSYTCTTQSELRFLLTKGRIDCSK